MKYILFRLKRFGGFISGFVFFIAGIFKLLDPVGTGLIMKEYFDFLHIGFLDAAAKPAGVGLAMLETLIGTALVTGIWRKPTAIAALAFQGVFTFLTLLLVIFNPEMDCGCFGEVIHLTHWQTFIKNIVLLALLCAFAFPLKQLGGPKKHKYASFAIVSVSVLAFTVYSLMYIPLVDHTAFHPAAALQAGNAFETSEDEMYEAVFVYEKEGEREEFSLEDLPDSTWAFVETVAKPKERFEDSAVSLSFYDSSESYQDSLAATGAVMLVSVYDTDIKPVKWRNIGKFMHQAEEAGFKVLLLVASTPANMENIIAQIPEIQNVTEGRLFYSDYKTLITLNRSNGGVTYFSDGYLICKWARRASPTPEELVTIHSGDDTEVIIDNDTKGSLAFQGFLLYVFAVMLLL